MTVKDIRIAIQGYNETMRRVVELRNSVKMLKELEESASDQRREIIKALEAMDLLARGNAGWEGRTVQFLSELLQ